MMKAVKKVDELNLVKLMENKTKCKRLIESDYGKKEYVSKKKIEEVRNIFRTRCRMLPFAGNFRNDQKYAAYNWDCVCGSLVMEREEHIVEECVFYREIREKFGLLDDDEVLCNFFAEVLAKRNEILL